MDQTEIDRVRAEYAERVKGPGKFEGEPACVAYYFDRMLDGGQDETIYEGEDPCDIFIVSDEDRAIFGADLPYAIAIWQDNSGFCCSRFFDDAAELDAARAECEAQDDSADE